MATVIKPKRSETALAVPAANTLQVGELALNVTDGKFYTKTSANAVKEVGGAGSVTFIANSPTCKEPAVGIANAVSLLFGFITVAITYNVS